MEVKKLNDAGGINGRKIEVIYEDDATDEAKAVCRSGEAHRAGQGRRHHRAQRYRPVDGHPR